MKDEINGLVANIVSAYVSKNAVAVSELPSVIQSVSNALSNLGKAPVESTPAADLKPAVPVRRSVTPEAITCLECGAKLKMLRRHLASDHDTTPAEYRAKWSLPNDYPMTAPNYAAQRSELAKKVGLGRIGSPRRGKKS
jgi:predicted transcriptional regulator